MKRGSGTLAVALGSIILGVLGMAMFVGVLIAEELEDVIHWRLILYGVASALLVATGVGLLRLRTWTLFSASAYVVGQLIFVGSIVKAGIADIAHRPWIVEPWMCEPPQLGGLPMTIELATTAALHLAWPVALLVFLRRPKVMHQLRSG